MNCVLIRYGEIGTKSRRTRRWWERIFMRNIMSALRAHNIKFSSISNPRGRIIVDTQNEKSLKAIKNVFGVSSVSFAKRIGVDLDEIKREALCLYRRKGQPGCTFRISTQRLNKQFPLTSQEVNVLVGDYIVHEEGAPVDLDYPEVDIAVEILRDAAYVFEGRKSGVGGIPVGVQGKVLINLKDEKSVIAGWMMLKRGCELVAYGTKELLSYLEPFTYGHSVKLVSDPDEAKDCLAEVFSELNLKKRNRPSFYPLLGLNEQQIQEIMAVIYE